jgi:hypothetical protein
VELLVAVELEGGMGGIPTPIEFVRLLLLPDNPNAKKKTTLKKEENLSASFLPLSLLWFPDAVDASVEGRRIGFTKFC